jgi:predicted acetyltransferase
LRGSSSLIFHLHYYKEMGMAEVTVTCPNHSKSDSDIVGCGATFTQEPDEEGWFDCPHCGMFFNEEGMRKEAPDAN